MKKRIVTLAMLLMSLVVVFGCNEPAASGPSVALVDTAVVFQECEAGQAGIAMLQGLSQQLQEEARAAQAAMEDNDSPEYAQQFQMAIARFQQVMGAEQQRIYTALNDALVETLDTYRTDNGLTVILDRQYAMSYDDAVDVTQKIVEAMNAKGIEISAPEVPALPSLEAPAMGEDLPEVPAVPEAPAE